MLAWFARCCGIDDRPDDAPAAPAGAPRGVQMARTRSGNYVQLQQALDQAAQAVAQASAAAAAQQQGPPPASAKTLSRIPIVRVVADDLTEDNECCTICLDAHVPGELAARLPCGHLFHKDCVMEWLRRHCVCPVCRYELPTDSVVYERARNEHNSGGRRVRVRKWELDAMGIRALLDVLKAAGESRGTCVEREYLIRRVLSSSRVDVVPETTIEVPRVELDAMSLGAVARLARRAGVVIDGALERGDVVALLEESGRVLVVGDAVAAVVVETTSPMAMGTCQVPTAAGVLDVCEDATPPIVAETPIVSPPQPQASPSVAATDTPPVADAAHGEGAGLYVQDSRTFGPECYAADTGLSEHSMAALRVMKYLSENTAGDPHFEAIRCTSVNRSELPADIQRDMRTMDDRPPPPPLTEADLKDIEARLQRNRKAPDQLSAEQIAMYEAMGLSYVDGAWKRSSDSDRDIAREKLHAMLAGAAALAAAPG